MADMIWQNKVKINTCVPGMSVEILNIDINSFNVDVKQSCLS